MVVKAFGSLKTLPPQRGTAMDRATFALPRVTSPKASPHQDFIPTSIWARRRLGNIDHEKRVFQIAGALFDMTRDLHGLGRRSRWALLRQPSFTTLAEALIPTTTRPSGRKCSSRTTRSDLPRKFADRWLILRSIIAAQFLSRGMMTFCVHPMIARVYTRCSRCCGRPIRWIADRSTRRDW